MDARPVSHFHCTEEMARKIIAYSETNGHLLSKFDEEFFVNYFDHATILAASRMIHPSEELSVHGFLKYFLLVISHVPEETLFLAMSLSRLFWAVLGHSSNISYIRFSDFTSYLCEKIAKEDLDIVIPSIQIPQQKVQPDPSRIREIDLAPPILVSKKERPAPKMSKEHMKRNRKLEHKKDVGQFLYSAQSKLIFALGTLSSSIYQYDLDLKLKKEIIPSACRESNSGIAILSIAYCRKLNRIGAIVNNVGLVFWEGSDDFTTEKTIGKCRGDTVYYLPLLDQWVTASHDTLHFWDIREESITNEINEEGCQLINDICQINHLRSICVAITKTSGVKLAIVYRQFKAVSKIDLGNSGCHTLHYNLFTQSLLPLGYKNIVQVYKLDLIMYDVKPISQLRGHNSLVTCIDSIQETSMVMTGDDMGEVRIWELNYMRCIQAIRVAKWLASINYIGDKLLFADTRLNILQLDGFNSSRREDMHGIYQLYDEYTECLWIVTRKDIRKMDLNVGRTTRIFLVCAHEEEISSAIKLKMGLLVGTSKGELIHYDQDGNLRWRRVAHEGEIYQLRYDEINKFIVSVGDEGQILFWAEKSLKECPRKSIIYRPRAVNLIDICPQNSLLLACSSEDKELSVWDYDASKLSDVIRFPSEITSIKVVHSLLLIATADSILTLIEFSKRDKSESKVILRLCLEDSLVTCMRLRPVIMDDCPSKYELIVGTVKGKILVYDVTELVEPLKTQGQIKESASMQRQSREDFESGIKMCNRRNVGDLPQIQNGRCKLLWSEQQHKEAVTHIEVLELQKGGIASLCTDSYFKISSVQDGELLCSMNINHPLPILWNITVRQESFVQRSVTLAAGLIQEILLLEGYELLANEYKQISLKLFLLQLDEFSATQPGKVVRVVRKTVPIMRDEYTPEDLKGGSPKEATLKSLQAYKRVKMIKQANEKSFELPQIHDYRTNGSSKDKDYLSHILSPNYLPELLNRNISDALPSLSCMESLSEVCGPTVKVKTARETKGANPIGQLVDALREKRRWEGPEEVKGIISLINQRLKKQRALRFKML